MPWIGLVVSSGAATMLVFAGWQHPYSYYQLLRVVTCAVAVYMAWCSYTSRTTPLTVMYGGIAALFNPFAPVYLSRRLWHPIDLVCAAAILAGAIVLSRSILPRFQRSPPAPPPPH